MTSLKIMIYKIIIVDSIDDYKNKRCVIGIRPLSVVILDGGIKILVFHTSNPKFNLLT